MTSWETAISALDQITSTLRELQRMQGGTGAKWAEADRQIVRDYYPDTPAWMIARALQRTDKAVYGMARKLGVTKVEDWVDNPLSNTTRTDPGRGRATRFTPGQTPWNRGKKGWKAGGRSAETRFKPGNISGRAAQLVEPVGSYRLDPSGILQRKIGTNPGAPHLRWRSVHELVWIEHNGPVPKGHVVVFRPGQRTNVLEQITLDRLECITRAELMRRNSFHNRYPQPVRQIIQLRGALTRKINNRRKDLD